MSVTFLAPDPVSVSLIGPSDRCDRCGSQAYVAVRLRAGELLFCAHHYREAAAGLGQVALAVRDDRERLDSVS